MQNFFEIFATALFLGFIDGLRQNITDLAAKLGLKPPYVTRVLGLNSLAPDIVEAIVAGATKAAAVLATDYAIWKKRTETAIRKTKKFTNKQKLDLYFELDMLLQKKIFMLL